MKREECHLLIKCFSHVAKLKEMIATQIEVASTDGMGTLSGAGVASQKDLQAALGQEGPAKAAKATSAKRRAPKAK